MYLFDTDIISRVVKASPPIALVDRLTRIPFALQFTTSINAAEVFYGACRVERREAIIRAFEKLVMSRLTVLPFDLESARVFGRLKAALESHGQPRSEPDLRIAAIALQHGLTIVTGNVRHFSGIPGLAVENWLL
jgi:tRNA(fMet)-specific endonuclease VapC